MLFNYIKIAFRNLLKHKSFSAINLLGLSFSMSVCLLIINIINDQLSYDTFHKNSARIYRVITKTYKQDNPNIPYATTFIPLATSLRNEAPGVENVVRITKYLRGDGKVGEKIIFVKGLFADDNFFDVFNFNLISGNPTSALTKPFSIVLSEKTAVNFFGNDDPIGKVIDISNQGSYTITGIIQDTKRKSHLTFDALASASTIHSLEKEGKIRHTTDNWNDYSSGFIYLKLNEGVKASSVEEILPRLIENNLEHEKMGEIRCFLQPLGDITPSPLMNNMLSHTLPVEVIWFMGFLALIIIISACINYTNLSISRALTRAKEVGVRKVSGAARKQLTFQFLMESVLYALISLVIAIFIYQLLLDAFNSMSIASEIRLDVQDTPSNYIWFICFGIGVGLLAGLFPALFLSSFKPIVVLKNFSGIKLFTRLTLRKSLIVMQFVISLFFIITAIVISMQSSFLINTDYGFARKNIVNIKLQDAKAEQFLHAISSRTDVIKAAATSHIPATGQSYPLAVRKNLEDEKLRFSYFYVDENYIDNLEIPLLAGENFPAYTSNFSEKHIIINEKGVAHLGYKNAYDAVGKSIYLNENDTSIVQIIGVVADYNHQFLLMDIRPMALRYSPNGLLYAHVKIKTEDIEKTLAGLESQWKRFDQVHAFDYQFFDDQLEDTYGFVKDLNGIISITAFLAIVVACLGLLGMAIYNAESRTKEVGVRKVMGAKISDIVLLLSKGFISLLIIAIVIAAPLAYFANKMWLQMIANHITFGLDIILYGILILLALGLITAGSQAIRAAFANPLHSLRDE